IVVIILAAVAFGTSTRTITNANWSTFTNAVGEVRTALQERVTTVKGEQAAKGITRSDAQVYNFVAKGGDIVREGGPENNNGTTVSGDVSGDVNDAWISSAFANSLTATRIEPAVIKEVLGLKNLNTIKVNTPLATNREVSYFVTNKGDVFVWPPYEYEGKMYVNETTVVAETANTLPTGSIKVGDVTVVLSGAESSPTVTARAAASATNAGSGVATVHYKDGSSATRPVGQETSYLFDDLSI
ncbi:MAG: hypothetical protein IJ215_03765, partial [Clostridia bacterium]|nr:hypothetical protein [Clostridia bacterium]